MPRLEGTALLRALDRLDAPTDEWLVGIARAILRLRRGRDGVCLFTYAFAASDDGIRTAVLPTGQDFDLDPRIFHAHMSVAALRQLYAPRTRVGHVGPMLLGHPEIGTMVRREIERRRVVDVFNVTASEPDEGVGFIVPDREKTFRPVLAELLSRTAEQVRLGLRFRHALADGPGPGAALMSPSGRVEAIGDELAAKVPLATLRELVRAREAARADRAGRTGVERGAGWVGILRGEWTCIDLFERSGRRHVVVAPVPKAMVPVRALDERERSVIEHVSRGGSAKEAAIDLQLGQAELSRILARALAKLGLRDRAALIQVRALVERDR